MHAHALLASALLLHTVVNFCIHMLICFNDLLVRRIISWVLLTKPVTVQSTAVYVIADYIL